MKARAYALPTVALLLAATAAHAQRVAGKAEGNPPPPAPAPKAAKEIPLYPGAAPGSEKWDWPERSVTNAKGLPMAQDVVRPVLLHYPADRGKAVGTAMIVAPGGGFRVLMMSYEGVDVARRLNAMGVDAFVLKYRLLYTGPGAPGAPAGGAPGGRSCSPGRYRNEARSGRGATSPAATSWGTRKCCTGGGRAPLRRRSM